MLVKARAVCSVLIHDQALSDPEKHANRQTKEGNMTTSMGFTVPQTPRQTHTHTVGEPLLKLAEGPVEDVAGQKD